MPAWDALSPAVAFIVGLVYITRTQRRRDQDLYRFLDNHLSEFTAATRRNTEAVDRLTDQTARLCIEFERLRGSVGEELRPGRRRAR